MIRDKIIFMRRFLHALAVMSVAFISQTVFMGFVIDKRMPWVDVIHSRILHATLLLRPSPLLMEMIWVAPLLIPGLVLAACVHFCFPRGSITDGETRCRACHHILRGLTEPRCPECGLRI